MKRIHIFDTTLRDGEQSPGCSMRLSEKLQIARQLEKLRVDVVEAGFAAASPGDFEAVESIARLLKQTQVAALARATVPDIDAAYNALKHAESPRIHTFIATSAIHLTHKLKMSEEAVLERIDTMVRYAKSKISNVEFSAEDASRTDIAFLTKVYTTAIAAGATVINVPDTVGFMTPFDWQKLISYLNKNIVGREKALLSVHCHNDLGLGTANSLAALLAGAEQVECTINGIGERAGNTALEEFVMALKVRPDALPFTTQIYTPEIYRTSKLLSQIVGFDVQPNKAIVGENAFSHASGIHQHGVLQNRGTYEIISPSDIGYAAQTIVLSKHSGRHAVENQLEQMGIELTPTEMETFFKRFKALADKKKKVYEQDLEALIDLSKENQTAYIEILDFAIQTGTTLGSTATLHLKIDGKEIKEAAIGDGPVDAAFNAIERACGFAIQLSAYQVKALPGGNDAMGEATVKIEIAGNSYTAKSYSTDITDASLQAYIRALNRYMAISKDHGTDQTRIEDKNIQ
jgi:2-isopropylmalate synthase